MISYKELKSIAYGENNDSVKRKALIDLYWRNFPMDLIRDGALIESEIQKRLESLDLKDLENEVKTSEFMNQNWD